MLANEIHYLDEMMAYTGCFKLIDNGLVRLETTDDEDKVTCEKCVDFVLGRWEENG